MPPLSLTFLGICALLFISWVAFVPRVAARRVARQSSALSELRQRLWDDEALNGVTDLLERNRVVFTAINPGWEQRLDHRLEDAGGAEIGSSLEQPRPGSLSSNGRRWRFSTVRVEIRDENDLKQIEIVRPSGLRTQPLEIRDGSGVRIGTIARDSWRSFAVRDASGARIGRIVRRSRGYEVDYALLDASGADVGAISDFAHLVERAPDQAGHETVRSLVKALMPGPQPEEHVLELRAPVSREFRSLMLGGAASVYLALQTPFEDGG